MPAKDIDLSLLDLACGGSDGDDSSNYVDYGSDDGADPGTPPAEDVVASPFLKSGRSNNSCAIVYPTAMRRSGTTFSV